MKVLAPISGERIASVLDVAKTFVLVDQASGDRHRIGIEETNAVMRAKRIAAVGPDLLICGAVSRPLESLLVGAGVRIIPNTCGLVDEVVAALFSGRFTDRSFLMPGCRGGRRRARGRRRRRRSPWHDTDRHQ